MPGLAVAYRARLGGAIAAALLVPLCLASILSGFAGGSFGDSALGAGQIAVQAAIVASTAVLVTLAGGQVATALHGRSLTSVAS